MVGPKAQIQSDTAWWVGTYGTKQKPRVRGLTSSESKAPESAKSGLDEARDYLYVKIIPGYQT